ncbi:MAG: hypothetical protein AAGI72_20435 [Pseudomonadota bacterium]
MEGLKELEEAQRLALAGNADDAEKAFSALAKAGSTPAAAALSTLYAYVGDWERVLGHAQKAIADPEGTYTFNVYSDVIRLAARAARETRQWSLLSEAVGEALLHFVEVDDEIGLVDELEDLREYLDLADPNRVFPTVSEPEIGALEEFREAVREATADDGQFDSPEERSEHLYSLAAVYEVEEGALELFDRGEPVPPDFEAAVFLAGALASAVRYDEAWNVVERALLEWMPVEVSQLAPVEFLTHPTLQLVMAPDRCGRILHTPRGSAGQ